MRRLPANSLVEGMPGAARCMRPVRRATSLAPPACSPRPRCARSALSPKLHPRAIPFREAPVRRTAGRSQGAAVLMVSPSKTRLPSVGPSPSRRGNDCRVSSLHSRLRPRCNAPPTQPGSLRMPSGLCARASAVDRHGRRFRQPQPPRTVGRGAHSDARTAGPRRRQRRAEA